MRLVFERYGTAIASLTLIAFFLLFAPNFASIANITNILKETSFLAVLALGFGLALTVAELDLSVADVASLAAVSAGWIIQSGAAPILAVLGGLAVGATLGAVNGFGVTKLKVPSLITTLATAAIAKGVAFWITQGVAFVGKWPVSFTGIARGTTLQISNLIWIMVVVTAFAFVLMNWTQLGAHMIATGEAEEAARLSGIATKRMKRLGLLFSGVFAGLTAIMLSASLSSAAPNMAGDYFLYAIAAVLLGMTMFEPGHPNVPGTVFAALVLKALGNGLVLMGSPYYAQDIVLGLIMISSVALSAQFMRAAAFSF